MSSLEEPEGGITAKIKHVTPKRNIRVFGEVHYPGEGVYDKSVMTRRGAVWTARRHRTVTVRREDVWNRRCVATFRSNSCP